MITAIARTEMEENIQACCKSLFLTSASRSSRKTARRSRSNILAVASEKEVVRRDENKRERLNKRARFPVYKTSDGYEYRCVKLPPALSKEDLEAVRFIEHKHNLVLFGARRCWQDPYGDRRRRECLPERIQGALYTVTELVLKLAEAREEWNARRGSAVI